jgi:hypothetical protein
MEHIRLFKIKFKIHVSDFVEVWTKLVELNTIKNFFAYFD